ncbi:MULTISPECIES: bifunctional 2-polyprenyl-6-hydroxyphenol methylase/3-demethylubiquinol 3-O-methyltransferase UbiG [unclassified Chelatococcus]|uniref:class I SAM-dependent methyltransferase n=1 Tax=unclassified Chelatococcus TaxID=2638111 RepID=UPI0002F00B8B|nr:MULTISPECIES: class I SAM-dependent methyltransferase [unclassified Chelatococcus]
MRLPSPDTACTPADLRGFFYDLYEDAPKPLRLLSAARPYVCPYDRIVPFVPQGARVLDVGCGTGALLALLVAIERIAEGVGCDVSAPALSFARGAAGRLAGGERLRFDHIETIDGVVDAPFDVVVMVDVLHHVPEAERQKVVAAAARRTAPGGVFIYKDMTDEPGGRRLAHTIDDLIFSHELVRQVSPEAVEHWAAGEGLELVASEYLPRLVYGHVLRVFRKPADGPNAGADA